MNHFLTRTASVCLALVSALALGGLSLPRAAAEKPAPKALLIDSHMHVWSGDPVRYPFAHPYTKDYKPPKTAATVELLVEEMDRSGVTHCVLVQTINHGWDNRYLVDCVKRFPKRFRGQGLIDPTDPRVAEKFEKLVREDGLSGVRFSPMYYQGKDEWINGDAHKALWKKAEELDAVLNYFIAADQLPRLEDMVKRYPKVKVVVDHLARVNLKAADPEPDVKRLLALARYPNVWVKVSELCILSPSEKYPYKDTHALVKRVYDAFGPDRLLWGTGFPGATRGEAGRPTLEQELGLIRRELPFLTDADRTKILGGNAYRLWKF
jgi:predicted TIM-barrel fold metal-dependent hydrolase